MKLTKQIHRKIAYIAKHLPAMHHNNQTVKIATHGKSLINHGISELKNGDSINPNKTYLSSKDIPKPVNHKKELEKMFVKHGEHGLLSYQKQILELAIQNGNKVN